MGSGRWRRPVVLCGEHCQRLRLMEPALSKCKLGLEHPNLRAVLFGGRNPPAQGGNPARREEVVSTRTQEFRHQAFVANTADQALGLIPLTTADQQSG